MRDKIAHAYHAPAWLPGGHAQTLYPALFDHGPMVSYQRERWDSTPNGKADGDFIELDRVQSTVNALNTPLVVQFHGLEGSSQSRYSRYLMAQTEARGWRGVVPHFRGCGGTMNNLPRAYHSGDSTEIDWILRRLRAEAPTQPIYVCAVSLGGNATLKWLGEQAGHAKNIADKVVAVSAPVDLTAAGNALELGFSKLYTYNFLKTMKVNAQQKHVRFPGSFDLDVMLASKTLGQFDNVVTAPLHGYRDTADYWLRASAKPVLRYIEVPTLLLNAKNDPFLPAIALPRADEVSAAVQREFPEGGGHVGFLAKQRETKQSWLALRAFHFFDHGN